MHCSKETTAIHGFNGQHKSVNFQVYSDTITVAQTGIFKRRKPLNFKGFPNFKGGADGTGFAGPFHPEVTNSRKTKMLPRQHLTYFKPFAFAPAEAGSSLPV